MGSTTWEAGAWRSVRWIFVALVAIGLLMQVVGPAIAPQVTGGWLGLAGLVLVVLPSVLWLLVFRRLDRLAPEPHYHLFGTMALGALVGSALGEPLRRMVFGLHVWTDDRWYWAIPIFALTQGVLLVLAIYASIRFSVFMLDEFDEPTDGIMYGAAAGLGVAVTYNLHYLADIGSLRLDVGAARIIIAVLVIASIGALVGYGLGQVQFKRRSIWFLPGVMVVAALLTGLSEWINAEAIGRSLDFTPWVSVVVAAAFAGLLFGAIDLLAHRTVRQTLATAEVEGAAALMMPPSPRLLTWLPWTPYGGRDGVTVSDLLMIGGGILLLLGGWALQQVHDSRRETAVVANLEVARPEGWLPLPVLPPALAQWTDNDGSGATLTLYVTPLDGGEEQDVTLLASPNPAAGQAAFTPLRSERATVGELNGVRADYAYAWQQLASSTPPEIVRGTEITWVAGDQLYALALEAPAADWDRIGPLFDGLAGAVTMNAGEES